MYLYMNHKILLHKSWFWHTGVFFLLNYVQTTEGFLSAILFSFFSAIDCVCETWRVNTSSIHGKVEGLFTTTKVNGSYNHSVTPEGGNVLLTGLCSGETYTVELEYETENRPLKQCNCIKTTRKYNYCMSFCMNWACVCISNGNKSHSQYLKNKDFKAFP